ncbi:MAG: diguanylate cyclase domain-containing protein [Henriciella sp.]|nr:diguanylate cyclase [Hyphomonadaceae bacterium]
MVAAVSKLGRERARGYSLTLIALIAFGGLQLGFLALDAVFHFSQQVLIIEAASALVVTLGCLAIVAREDRRMEKAAEMAESQLSYLADFATDLYWETDLEGIVIASGGRLAKIVTPDRSRIIGQHYMKIIKLEPEERQRMMKALSEIKPYSDILSVLHDPQGKAYHISLSATPRFDRDGNVVGYLGIGTNVSKRIEAQSRLRYMAEHDMLTGLANRYSFQNQINEDILNSGEDENVGLLAIDLDNFKTINDTYGHPAGDALLNLVAKRIGKIIRGDDWAARLGGDEFVIVCRDVANPMDACLMAARLISALSRPFQIGGLEVTVSASIGVACAPLHAKNSRQLMKCADLAMYEAKSSGRSCYRLFEAPHALDAPVH